MKIKKVRMLLRVSSNQQLEADGDLSIQRQLVKEYIEKQVDWQLDTKEYFEGSKSGYKNSVEKRVILQEILEDARNREFDILAVYKDDRVGRRMWEMGMFVMALKNFGVDIYTVKDGCITPDESDMMGQIELALRYGVAQKSSSDTGMRVKDTAQKLVMQGKFMGGSAPYGYKLELNGEFSKHGRALHHLVIVPEQAEVVKHIFKLSLNKEYGSVKIAKDLNNDDKYKKLAPHGVWKSGTVTSILTNPIYAGHTAYKRREKVNGKYRRLDSKEWIISEKVNEDVTIIDSITWNRTQEKRKQRGNKYMKLPDHQDVTVIRRNDGMLPLIDVIHCGYCGCKLVNGSRYNYWTIKDTGEKKTRRIAVYKCQDAWQGVPHDKTAQFCADTIEPIVFKAMAEYIAKLQENEDVFEKVEKNQNKEKEMKKIELEREYKTLNKINQKISIMERHIPDAMTDSYPVTLNKLMDLIKKEEEMATIQLEVIRMKEIELKSAVATMKDWDDLRKKLPTWQEIFLEADEPTKRVLVNKLIERIDVKKNQMVIRFKINLNDFL